MKDRYLFHILQIVRYEGTIDSLINLGLEYSQIVSLISDATNQGYIRSNDGVLELTQLGLDKIDELNEKLYKISTTKWILPKDELRIEKIDKFEVYLPNPKKPGF